MTPRSRVPDASAFRFGRVPGDGVMLHVAEAGPLDGPPLILLHGFPEFWGGWRHQAGALAAAGFRVIMPDQRGYNLSDKPGGVAAYDLDRAAADVLALAEHFDIARLNVVGHDWGASVVWWLASTRPACLERAAVINAPHPAIWRRAMRADPDQRRKSWYVQMFRLPWLPEALMRSRNWRGLSDGIVTSSRPGTFDDAVLADYRQAWAQPGAVTAMVHWYRALLRKPFPEVVPRIPTPLLLIWGMQDAFGAVSVAEASLALCDRPTSCFVETATHWVHHEEPERVNAALLAHFPIG